MKTTQLMPFANLAREERSLSISQDLPHSNIRGLNITLMKKKITVETSTQG